MRNVRVVSTIAAALAAALVASPALAAGQSVSVLDQPQISAPHEEDIAIAAIFGTWINATPIPGVGLVRYGHAQCIGENSFYIVSGVAQGALTPNVARYDAGPNTWTPRAPYPNPGEGPVAACFNGKIYAAGGSAGLTNFNIFDIATNAWTPGPAAPRPNVMAHMAAHNGRVYLIGGDDNFQPADGVSNVVNIYDIATNTWLANGAPMPTGAVSGGVAKIGDFIYIVGGWITASPGANSTVTQRYDTATNTWTVGPVFTSGRADLAAAATNVALYSIGGDANGGGFFNSSPVVERLDVSTWPAGAWAAAADNLPVGLGAMKGGFCTESFFPASGEIWSTGGLTSGFQFVTTNQYHVAESCPTSFDVEPTALALDPTGNNVLEPNEAAATMAPSWRNNGTTAVPGLTGVASNFVGPAGGTYTIDDSTADYGTVAAGATATCTTSGNCYAVTVTAATRPVVHWDTTITETLAPAGNVQDWTVHVGASFTDVPTSNPFYRFIETLLHHGVTGGCTSTTYCPANSTTREQMSVFVLVAKEGVGYLPPQCAQPNFYLDVPETSPFCRWIEELANRGVVTGCAPAMFCPTAAVTREQMAVFVLRTLDPTLNPTPCAPPNIYADVPETNGFCRWIEELTNRGIVTGCGGGNYCPLDPVTREQMGVFISVTFGLTLYGP